MVNMKNGANINDMKEIDPHWANPHTVCPKARIGSKLSMDSPDVCIQREQFW